MSETFYPNQSLHILQESKLSIYGNTRYTKDTKEKSRISLDFPAAKYPFPKLDKGSDKV